MKAPGLPRMPSEAQMGASALRSGISLIPAVIRASESFLRGFRLRFDGGKVTQTDLRGFRLVRTIARFSKHDFWNLEEIWDRNR